VENVLVLVTFLKVEYLYAPTLNLSHVVLCKADF